MMKELDISRWEYKTADLWGRGGIPNAETLNELAAEGWEYCQSSPVNDKGSLCRVLLRRPWQPARQLTADELYEKVCQVNAELGGEFMNKQEKQTPEKECAEVAAPYDPVFVKAVMAYLKQYGLINEEGDLCSGKE